ncbi:MAG TPA: helix-turn-helix domain-containing protein [Gemmatimonadaceae bacterium]
MISRERILEAASRVYSKHGFRGATTRLIAQEAGVNEVTLFRTFGSKSALMQAVLVQQQDCAPPIELTDDPVDPQWELQVWIQTSLDRLRDMRHLLLHSMGESDERPDAAQFACQGRRLVHDIITRYVRALKRKGLADASADEAAAAVVLIGTVMSDAIARGFAPDVYPPMDQAAERYTSCFLRMLGVKQRVRASVRRARMLAR